MYTTNRLKQKKIAYGCVLEKTECQRGKKTVFFGEQHADDLFKRNFCLPSKLYSIKSKYYFGNILALMRQLGLVFCFDFLISHQPLKLRPNWMRIFRQNASYIRVQFMFCCKQEPTTGCC